MVVFQQSLARVAADRQSKRLGGDMPMSTHIWVRELPAAHTGSASLGVFAHRRAKLRDAENPSRTKHDPRERCRDFHCCQHAW